MWNHIIQSESLSISLMVLIIAVWLSLLQRWRWEKLFALIFLFGWWIWHARDQRLSQPDDCRDTGAGWPVLQTPAFLLGGQRAANILWLYQHADLGSANHSALAVPTDKHGFASHPAQ